MQVVGRPCEICSRVIKSKLDGVGCVACERFFHDACVLAPPAELAESASDTYRTQAVQPKKPAKRASRKVRCPSCGADVRKEERERDRIVATQREEHEERRRVKESSRDRTGLRSIFLLRALIAFVFFVILVIARLTRP